MRVRHQNIVRFVGYCYETWLKYTEYNGVRVFAERPKRLLCFEYIPNGSLDKYISDESCGLDWHRRYKIIKGICCGLHYLHNECQINASVIHLDLKPANILLDDNMVPKITDFGLSKLFDDQKVQTCVTTLAGS
uniref:non-specific serine/threonine protein kinase n=1 Tax=Arundo donax TaxID=35708 RepID=A0A0A9AJ24_ARUDO